MTKIPAILAFAAAVAVACPAPSMAAKDEAVGNVSITIKPIQGKPRLDFTKTRDDLATLHKEKGLAHDIQGLTISKSVGEIKAHFAIRKSLSLACMSRMDIEAILGYQTPVVLVAKENRQGTCERNAIIKHEMRHVKVFEIVSRRAIQRARSDLLGVAEGWIGRCADTEEELQEAAMGDLKREMERISGLVEAENAELQAIIDTPKEYKRVEMECAHR